MPGNIKITKPVKVAEEIIPEKFALYQNYPNPFNPSTTIKYQVSKRAFVNITVFDALGRIVKTLVNSWHEPGRYAVVFDAKELPSGIYFYRMKANNFVDVKKMVLLK